MNTKEIAAQLNGVEYPVNVPSNVIAAAKQNGIVIVYGASDDLMEFEGAIADEIGCYDGGMAYLTNKGLLENECDDSECPYFQKLQQQAATIEAIWGKDGYSWQYRTTIPHETFEVTDDGEHYCRGIVFRLADVPEVAR